MGFEKAGFEPILAYDIFPAAVDTYNYNHIIPIARIADLNALSANDIIREVEKKYNDLQPVGIIGGPPCQAFSRSNVFQREDDIRRTLPGRYAYLLKEINQHYHLGFFVFENVQGITFQKHQEDFSRFRGLFEEAGFYLYEALLNAKDYNVPKDRPRVFIVGINKEFGEDIKFEFPQTTTPEPKTVRQAFGEAFGTPPWPEPALYEPGLRRNNIPFHPNHWTMVPRSEKFTNGCLLEGQIVGRSFRVLARDKPSWTVAYRHREIHIHPFGKRRLSIYEAMALQGFPKEYVLLGNLIEQVTLVSDAVPPPLGYAIANQIFSFIEQNQKLLITHQNGKY